MGFIAAAIGVIASSVAAAAVVVAATVVTVVSAISAAIVAAGAAIYGALAGVVVGGLNGLGVITSLTAANTLTAIGAMNVAAVTTFSYVSTFVSAIATGISSFLNAIHFQTLKSIHSIAYLVSDDYRSMINEVYSSIQAYSKQLNLGSTFMLLAVTNARTVVLDVSSMLGRKYDLGEVTWLNELDGYLKKVNTVGKKYKSDPGALLQDLNDWLIKPAIDTKATIMQGVLEQFENTVIAVDTTVQELLTIKNDVEKLVADLPETIRVNVEPYIKSVTDKIDVFITDKYNVNKKLVESFINVASTDIAESKGEIRGILDRMLYPGDYISEVKNLSDWQQDQQIGKIYDVVLPPVAASSDKIAAENVTAHEQLSIITAAVLTPIEYEEWYSKEVTVPVAKPLSEIDRNATWFVGDY